MNALALAEINALSLSFVTPSLLSSVKALQMIAGDVGVDDSHDTFVHDSGADDAHDDHALPIISESLVVSSREENIDIVQDGLTFRLAQRCHEASLPAKKWRVGEACDILCNHKNNSQNGHCQNDFLLE